MVPLSNSELNTASLPCNLIPPSHNKTGAVAPFSFWVLKSFHFLGQAHQNSESLSLEL